MEEEMKELYAEGLATHGGPESCVDDPRGRGEALTGARAGRAIEPRNEVNGVPTLASTPPPSPPPMVTPNADRRPSARACFRKLFLAVACPPSPANAHHSWAFVFFLGPS